MKKFKLDDIEKIESPFEAPKGYFDALPQQIQKKMQAGKKQRAWQFRFNPRYALAMACVALMLVFGVKFLVQDDGNSEVSLADISEQQIRQYLLQEGIYEHDLINFYIQNSDNQANSEEASVEEEILDEDFDLEEMEELL